MSIVRVQKNSNYSVISNVHLQDESLSWKAKGLLSYLLSKPDNWQVYVAHLKNQSTDGRDATASGIRELIEAGYITRDYSRNKAGQITGRNYVVHEAALEEKAVKKPVNLDENPKTENPLTVKPTTVDPKLSNTDITKDGLKKNNDDVQPSSLSHKNSKQGVQELVSLIQEQFQKPSIEKTIERGLKAYSKDYVRSAIEYTNDHSSGNTWQKYGAYLDKAINYGYAAGYQSDTSQAVDHKAMAAEFKKMSDDILKMLGDAGNQFAIDELAARRRNSAGKAGRVQ